MINKQLRGCDTANLFMSQKLIFELVLIKTIQFVWDIKNKNSSH